MILSEFLMGLLQYGAIVLAAAVLILLLTGWIART